MRRVFSIAATAAVTAALLHAAPASADDVVVRGLGFAVGSPTGLVITGCPGIFDRSAEPIATYLSKRDGAPAGTRSFKYDLAGGNAVGPRYLTSSMAETSVAGLSLFAGGGSTGVAYAGYRAPEDADTDLVWVGRAELTEEAGGWRSVDAVGLTYAWTKYDLSTQESVGSAEAAATVPAFMAANGGDGPGFYTVGFGCDGEPFKIDALRFGDTTYDLEGYTSNIEISGSHSQISVGEEVTLHGVLRDGADRSVPRGLLVLEQSTGGGEFTPVEGAARAATDGDPSVTVRPDVDTEYRWRFAGTPSVEGSTSPTFSVNVSSGVAAPPDGQRPGRSAAEPAQSVAEPAPVSPARPRAKVTSLPRHRRASPASRRAAPRSARRPPTAASRPPRPTQRGASASHPASPARAVSRACPVSPASTRGAAAVPAAEPL